MVDDNLIRNILDCYFNSASYNVIKIKRISIGNINQTILVRLVKGDFHNSYILQRINNDVFRCPSSIMENFEVLSNHFSCIEQRKSKLIRPLTYRLPSLVRTLSDETSIFVSGSYWRVFCYIESSLTLDVLTHSIQAKEVGASLSLFHHYCSDLPINSLKIPIRGFHDIFNYYSNNN